MTQKLIQRRRVENMCIVNTMKLAILWYVRYTLAESVYIN